MDYRLQQLKASAKAGSEKARQDLHSQAEKLRANLDADRASIEAAKTRMKDWAAGKKATFNEKVVQWKAQRTQEQLKLVEGKLVLAGATRDALKDTPEFEYAQH